MLLKLIVIKGVMAIQSGDNPRIVEQKLKTFLPARSRESADDEKKADRRAAWRLFSNLKTGTDNGTPSREEFEEEYPPGYFARLNGMNHKAGTFFRITCCIYLCNRSLFLFVYQNVASRIVFNTQVFQ